MFYASGDGTVVGVNIEDIEFIFNRLIKTKYDLLDYSTPRTERYYGKSAMKWVQLDSRQGLLRAPYNLVIDYRNWAENCSLGEVTIHGNYSFPTELSEHRNRMIQLLSKNGQLKRGNNQCPRISDVFIQESGIPKYNIEKAWYYDQVGTNLTLDYPLNPPIVINGFEQYSVRDWDIFQAGNIIGYLPDMNSSRLANTIGVAIGITATNYAGREVIIIRKRNDKVAVYPNMLHLPFSFALSPPENDFTNGYLIDLIKFDLGHEQAQELGLEPTDLGPLKPLSFCRDLVRGGKPQFFFEQHANISCEELCKNIQETTPIKEYQPGIKVMDNNQNIPGDFSPELACYLLLKAQI